jgi:lipopolysaccharide/colanic/teichoic acid biosynthesis glycosyltransferase
MKLYASLVKPLADRVLGLVMLVHTWPIVLVAAILLSIRLRSLRVLFIQTRPGLHAKPFRIYKLKTLLDLYNSEGQPLTDEQRRFPLGDFLRRLSIDELPQAINLLNGTMSLVGPRPLLMEYLPHYTERQQLRLTVKPGLIGPAQLAGRNSLDWPTRLELDAQYAEGMSLLTDIQFFIDGIANFLIGKLNRGTEPIQRYDIWLKEEKDKGLATKA